MPQAFLCTGWSTSVPPLQNNCRLMRARLLLDVEGCLVLAPHGAAKVRLRAEGYRAKLGVVPASQQIPFV